VRKAFTLIELLVVISIIALLIAILSQVPGKYEEILLTKRIRQAEWGHEREEKALDFALGGVGGEAVDLPLCVAGGGSKVRFR